MKKAYSAPAAAVIRLNIEGGILSTSDINNSVGNGTWLNEGREFDESELDHEGSENYWQ